jgi:propionyl-CoA carboxylase alpha chain
MRRVLVANRGEIARRIFRTCAHMGIGTVAVYSEPDRESPYVSEADLAVPLGGETSTESYLDISKIIEAATASGADAVHPGYGFLAEHAEFAERCLASNLIWVGPPPAAIRAMALKVQAKSLAAAAGIPLLAGATVDGDDPARWQHDADLIGYPLLVKASAGGGGKGMRVVEDVGELAEAVRAARREAASAFGDPTVFLERYLASPRHVEMQVMADRYGAAVHLLDRDCSLQRRHQKVVEEAPAPDVPDGLRGRMQEAAVSLTRSIGYEGAGTIEFLVAGDEFFFLEMNTRLQVEHPVTEEITGLDLVRLQIEIASGRPLPFEQDQVSPSGHAIEVRLYAEDPSRDFLPSVGTVTLFEPRALSGIRWENGVRTGSSVSPHYDPMLAKVIAHAGTREEAAHRLSGALRQLRLAGLRTNRDFLIATLESGPFLEGRLSTAFFDQHPELLSPAVPIEVIRHAAVALAHILRHRSRPSSPVSSVAPPGWRSLPAVPRIWTFESPDGKPMTVSLPPNNGAPRQVTVDDEELGCETISIGTDRADLVVAGLRRSFATESIGTVHWLNGGGWQIQLEQQPRFPSAATDTGPGGPASPLPGTIVAVSTAVGDTVAEGQLLVVLEAMKMEHQILADAAGRVSAIHVSVGDRVDAHQLLVTVEPHNQQGDIR